MSLSHKRQVSGEISSAKIILPFLSFPNSILKSTKTRLASKYNFCKSELIFSACSLILASSSSVTISSATA